MCTRCVWPCACPCALSAGGRERFHGTRVGRPAALEPVGWGTPSPHSPRAAERPEGLTPPLGPSRRAVSACSREGGRPPFFCGSGEFRDRSSAGTALLETRDSGRRHRPEAPTERLPATRGAHLRRSLSERERRCPDGRGGDSPGPDQEAGVHARSRVTLKRLTERRVGESGPVPWRAVGGMTGALTGIGFPRPALRWRVVDRGSPPWSNAVKVAESCWLNCRCQHGQRALLSRPDRRAAGRTATAPRPNDSRCLLGTVRLRCGRPGTTVPTRPCPPARRVTHPVLLHRRVAGARAPVRRVTRRGPSPASSLRRATPASRHVPCPGGTPAPTEPPASRLTPGRTGPPRTVGGQREGIRRPVQRTSVAAWAYDGAAPRTGGGSNLGGTTGAAVPPERGWSHRAVAMWVARFPAATSVSCAR